MFGVRTPFIVLAPLLLYLLVDAEAKRGGGGDVGGSGDSGSSGSDGGGGSSDNQGPQHTTISGPHWPYRWSGSYYNGSVTVQAAILRWPNCNKGSEDSIMETFDGILNVGPADDNIAFDKIAPRFTLVGWDAGTEPADEWTDAPSFSNSGPSGYLWFSPDVRIMFSRYFRSWEPTGSGLDTYDLNWRVDLQPGDGNGNFRVNGSSTRDSIYTYEIRDNTNDNWLNITAPGCNSSMDALMMQLIQVSSTIQPSWGISGLLHNATMEGMFSDSEATFYWTGSFIGGFRNTDWGRIGHSEDRSPIGNFNVTFRGSIDSSQSDSLTQRTTPLSGYPATADGPEWDVTIERGANEPSKSTWYGSAGSIRQSTVVVWMVTALVCIFTCSR